MRIVRRASEVEPYIDQIRAMADSDKEALGFLPDSVFSEQLQRERLWIALDSDQCSGFLMFGGKFPYLRIHQLYVRPEVRQKAIGRSLVEELATYGERHSFLQIRARVAADLPANRFWESLGFELAKQKAGGASTRRTINIRIRELNSPSLLEGWGGPQEKPLQSGSWAADSPLHRTDTFAIDLNIFFDVVKGRVDSEYSNRVIANAWMRKFDLFLTPEFEVELSREDVSPDPALSFARTLPVLEDMPQEDMDELISDLRPMVFPQHSPNNKRWPQCLSDLRHLAFCINAQVTGFITRDGALLRVAKTLRERFSLEVLSPLDVFDWHEPQPKSAPFLTSSSSGHVLVSQGKTKEIARLWSQVSESDVASESLGRIFLDPASNRNCLSQDDHVIAAATWRQKSSRSPDLIAVAVVDETSPMRARGVDHLLETLLRTGNPMDVRSVHLSLPRGQDSLSQTALDRGFTRMGTSSRDLVKLSVSGALGPQNWPAFSEALRNLAGLRIDEEIPAAKIFENTGICVYGQDGSLKEAIRLFEFETLFSPGLVLCPGRHGLLVPIRGDYAEDLLWDPNTKGTQLSFLPSNKPLFLEKAYFRSPQGSDALSRGMPVVFYVSKRGGGPGEAIGWARCTFSDVMTIRKARRSLIRHGVLDYGELAGVGKHGRIHAFTFDSFNRFPRSIDFQTLKANRLVSGANLVTHQAISASQLEQIFHLAFGATSE